MKIAIVGGCFTEQHNIPFSCLYHQTLKDYLKEDDNNIEITTIRYERISKCLDKIIELKKTSDFDLLILHLRAEPLMRISKLYYKYLDDQGILHHAINLPYFKFFYTEKFDLLDHRRFTHQENIRLKSTKGYHILREANYILGSLIGNKIYALNILKRVVLDIQSFCKDKDINFLLLGPVSRPVSFFEDSLSRKINCMFEDISQKESISYLNLIKSRTKDHQPMFFENGIHVSQAGHNEIAEMIYMKIKDEN